MIFNAFFVAGEFALVAVDRSRVRRLAEQGDRRAALVDRSLKRLSFELSGAQLGITVTSLIVGAIAEPAIATIIEPVLRRFGFIAAENRLEIAIVIAIGVATIVQMLLGELVPKNFAIAKPYPTAVVVGVPMAWVNGLLRPIVLFLNQAANWTVRKLGIEPREELAGVRSLEELEMVIRSSGEGGELDDAELSLLTRAISFTEKVAADVMVPRVAVVGLSRHESVAELRRLARETGHSRFPVYDEDLDEIVGIVHVKDSFRVPQERRPITPVATIAKPPLAVPHSRPLDDLLVDMQRQSRALAVIVDEYGGTAGIVTIEDLLEELIGEIADEHDPVVPEEGGVDTSEKIVVSGQINRHGLEEQLGFRMPEGRFETLGGFITSMLGRFPSTGELVTFDKWQFEILTMEGRRIDRVAVIPPGAGEQQ
ncbi:MAG TPA: hemolysin family protein [Acidimicrobiia bacterium]|nr:hemolysin family protein [Acidimicrobiia bacterium]